MREARLQGRRNGSSVRRIDTTSITNSAQRRDYVRHVRRNTEGVTRTSMNDIGNWLDWCYDRGGYHDGKAFIPKTGITTLLGL
jgi:hypothetical protein